MLSAARTLVDGAVSASSITLPGNRIGGGGERLRLNCLLDDLQMVRHSRHSSTFIVTGSSRGIGAAIAAQAGAAGYSVVVNFESAADQAAQVVSKIVENGGRAFAAQADVTCEDDVVNLFEIAEQTFGPIGGLVNNAGITGGFSRVDSLDVAAVARMLQVNVMGMMMCCREAVRRMSTSRGGSGGAIVNISSLAARTGGSGEWVHYAASKGAVDSFTIGLAREVANEGIRVNAVAPGLIETDLHAANGEPGRPARIAPTIPMQRVGTPDEVAAGVMWLLSPAASYVTGTILEIGGGR